MSSFYFRPFKTLTSLLYYFSFLKWITLSIVRMFDYDRLFTRCTRCPPGSTCLCVHERWWRQCDWIWRTMFFDEDIKSVYYYYHVECLFFVLFFLVRERFMIKYLRAHVCACLFGYPPQSGKWIEKKNWQVVLEKSGKCACETNWALDCLEIFATAYKFKNYGTIAYVF